MLRHKTHALSSQPSNHYRPIFDSQSPAPRTLKLLSFNIQVGIHTQAPHHYLTRGWQHLFPHPGRHRTLDQIARVIHDYDLVALQEVDGGSFRSGYVNQVRYLAQAAHFPFWYQQLNRNFGRLAQHSNGLLSRFKPCSVHDHQLPGLMPGRGAIVVEFGTAPQSLLLVILHLSLGSRSQVRQLNYIRELIGDQRSVVVMGDLNCHHERLLQHSTLREINLQPPSLHLPTYPSWQPTRALDHILVSDNLKVLDSKVLDLPLSDHLPIALEIELPTLAAK